MKSFLFLIGFFIGLFTGKAQLPFKNDNVLYNAVFLNEAFKLMEKEKSFLLLDVRSPGEYADTSSRTALNIGRLKGAVNIDVDAVAGRLNEIDSYKDKPVFIYCSHSQRSRRISKLLSEKGFKKIYNINGGMSLVNELDVARFPFKNKALEVNTSYKNIASVDAANLVRDTQHLVIIDIRSAPEFASKDSLARNNIGRLKNAINIPQAEFATKFDTYRISPGRPVLLYDLYGNNSMDVVDVLKAKGFTRIYNLYGGLAAFSSNYAIANIRSPLLIDPPPYRLLDPQATMDLLSRQPNTIVIDTRTGEEFENKASVPHHNLGRMKNAINVNTPEALEKLMQQSTKDQPILVYGGMTGEAAFNTSEALAKKGFKNVHLLSQGLYRFVWAAHNVEACKAGKEFLTHHEGLY